MALRHWTGKLRRFWQSHARKGFVGSQHARRRGECRRCGRCCALGVRCAFLREAPGGGAACAIYERRPLQCRTFPITPADLEEAGCPGFTFEGGGQ